MKELSLKASIENLVQVQEFIKKELQDYELSLKTEMEIEVAVEEIFVNIAQYAYRPKQGEIMVRCEVVCENVPTAVISFMDWGKAFNPLEKEESDVTLSAEERQIGGLGIFMVKKLMDEVAYRYEEHKNIFTIWKKIQ